MYRKLGLKDTPGMIASVLGPSMWRFSGELQIYCTPLQYADALQAASLVAKYPYKAIFVPMEREKQHGIRAA